MNDHFLLEAIWVLFTYGRWSLVCGLAISSVIVIWGSRRASRPSRMTMLAAATFVLWFALIVGVEYGYHAWQSIPNPPEQAFSDTGGPGITLLLGWLPSLVLLGIVHVLLRLCCRNSASNPTPPPESPFSSV